MHRVFGARGSRAFLRFETVADAFPPRIIIGSHDIEGVTRLLHVSGPSPEIVWTSGAPT